MLSMIVRAISQVLRVFGHSVVVTASDTIVVEYAGRRVWFVARSIREVPLDREILEDRWPIIFVDEVEGIQAAKCPLLARRVTSITPQSWLCRTIDVLTTSNSLNTFPSVCNVPCIFQRCVDRALKSVEHDRFGKFRSFGVGKRAFADAGSPEDTAVMKSYLEYDLQRLRTALVDCTLVAGKFLYFTRVLQLLEGAIAFAHGAETRGFQDAATEMSRVLKRWESLERKE